MPRTIRATRARVRAARLIVERADRPADHDPRTVYDVGEPDALFSSELEEPTVAPGSTEIEEPTVRR